MKYQETREEAAARENISNMVRDYQAVLSSEIGIRVLCDLLTKNYFFSQCRTEEERIRRNVAVELLQNAGLLHVKTLRPLTEAIVQTGRSYPLISDAERETRPAR
jgi:hypothetical protein